MRLPCNGCALCSDDFKGFEIVPYHHHHIGRQFPHGLQDVSGEAQPLEDTGQELMYQSW